MVEKKIVKTVRFKEGEIERIEAFLHKNPALDFSTLVRLAVGEFISDPSLKSVDKYKAKSCSASLKDVLWN